MSKLDSIRFLVRLTGLSHFGYIMPDLLPNKLFSITNRSLGGGQVAYVFSSAHSQHSFKPLPLYLYSDPVIDFLNSSQFSFPSIFPIFPYFRILPSNTQPIRKIYRILYRSLHFLTTKSFHIYIYIGCLQLNIIR